MCTRLANLLITYVFLSFFLSPLAVAQNTDTPATFQTDEKATIQAPWQVGSVIAEESIYDEGTRSEPFAISRKFIGVDLKGYYVVQDFYQPNGQKRSDPFALMKREDVDKIDESYAMPLIDGQYIIWFENGQKLVEGQYQDGVVQGHWTWWFENGQKSLEGQFQGGLRQGLWTEWLANGQKKTQHYFQDREQQDTWIEWYDNGQKWFEGQYLNGEQQDTWIEWHDNGQKSLEGQYRDGKEQGLWTFWDLKGSKTREVVFDAGNVVSEFFFD